MFSRMRVLSNLVVLVFVGLLFAGCLGSWAKGQTVEEFFEEVSATFLSQDAAKIADLWSYPLTFEVGTFDREDVQAIIHVSLSIPLKIGGASLETFEILDAESDVLISGDGKTATVSNMAVHVTLVAQTPASSSEFTRDVDPFELIKVGKRWKFNGINDFLDVSYGAKR